MFESFPASLLAPGDHDHTWATRAFLLQPQQGNKLHFVQSSSAGAPWAEKQDHEPGRALARGVGQQHSTAALPALAATCAHPVDTLRRVLGQAVSICSGVRAAVWRRHPGLAMLQPLTTASEFGGLGVEVLLCPVAPTTSLWSEMERSNDAQTPRHPCRGSLCFPTCQENRPW